MSVDEFIRLALLEDIGRGDLFSRVSDNLPYSATVISNANCVLAGCTYVKRLCEIQGLGVEFLRDDSDSVVKGDVLLKITGKSSVVLESERVILNILQHASGIATNVHRYTSITSRYATKLLDTRKTRPLLRVLEKYAARVGGAINHRCGLDDALMIKDTHRKSIQDLPAFLSLARSKMPFTSKIELECETLQDALDAFCLDIDILMCDNMLANDIATVMQKKSELGSHILVEASGGITLDNIEEYCKVGVDAISVGSLIHQAVWQDFSMKGVS